MAVKQYKMGGSDVTSPPALGSSLFLHPLSLPFPPSPGKYSRLP